VNYFHAALAVGRSLARLWHGALRKGKPMPATRRLRFIPIEPARDRRPSRQSERTRCFFIGLSAPNVSPFGVTNRTNFNAVHAPDDSPAVCHAVSRRSFGRSFLAGF
jgi:hypothetical protein